MVGGVAIGGGAPVVVQSMTNTDTKDAASTAQQVADLARAGSEIVRITVNNREAAAQVPEIVARLDDRMPVWRDQYPGVEELHVAVMGCIVNGPGESRAANIGISLPGTGEEPRAPVYVDGEKVTTLEGPNLAGDFIAMVEKYVDDNYRPVKGTA